MQKDIDEGLRYLDIRATLSGAGPVAEVALAKIEHTVEHGTMPPGQYFWMDYRSRKPRHIR